MKKSVRLAVSCLNVILICAGCSTRQHKVSDNPAELMRASYQKTNGIPEDLMRSFSIVITLREETVKEAIIRLMREEVMRFETELAAVKQTGTVAATDKFKNPYYDSRRHYFYLEDAVRWNDLFPNDADQSEVSLAVSCECDEKGPISESINIVPAEFIPDIKYWRDFANIAGWTISELPPSAGKLIVNRLLPKLSDSDESESEALLGFVIHHSRTCKTIIAPSQRKDVGPTAIFFTEVLFLRWYDSWSTHNPTRGNVRWAVYWKKNNSLCDVCE